MKRTCIFILLGLAILGLGTVVTAAPVADTLENYIIGAGGAKVVTGANEVSFTLGQPVVGEVEVGTHALCAGYWCETEWRTYVPVVMRNM